MTGPVGDEYFDYKEIVNYLPQGWRPWARASMYAWDPKIVPGLNVSVWQYDGRFVRVYRVDSQVAQNKETEEPVVFVLIHGIGVSARYFTPLMNVLSRYGSVLSVDLPGFSNLPNPRYAMSISQYADVLRKVLVQAGYLKRDKTQSPQNAVRVVVLGHSMGAQIAAELVGGNNDELSRLCLVGPPTYLAERNIHRLVFRFLQSAFFESPMLTVLAIRAYFACGPVWMIKTLPFLLSYPIEETLCRLEGQILLVRGYHDHVAPSIWLEELADYAHRATTRPKIFQIQDGAHGVIHRYAPVLAHLLVALAGAPVEKKKLAGQKDLLFVRQNNGFQQKVHALMLIATRHGARLSKKPRMWKKVSFLGNWVSVAFVDFSLSFVTRLCNFLRYPFAAINLRGAAWSLSDPKDLEVSKISMSHVVFIPGIFEDWRAFVPLGRFLERRGFSSHHLPQLGFMLHPWQDLVQCVADYLQEEDLREVTIVAHSKGGLVAKGLLCSNCAWRIKKIIALGVPWRGSSLADLVPNWRLYADLSTKYPATVDQFSDRSVNDKIVSITARYDQQVPNSQFLPGARNLKVRAVGHNRLISHPKTWRVVYELLKESE